MPRKKLSNIAAGQINTNSRLNPFGQFKWGESYTSLILGLVVVIISSILLVSFAKNINRHNINLTQQTLSQKTEEVNKVENKPVVTEQFYTVSKGEDLWHISEKFYKTGYNWVAIAKENKLENPDIIYAGLKLKMPQLAVVSAQEKVEQIKVNETKQDTVINNAENVSIKGDTYKVQKGDYLWDIAVRAYGDGFKWTDIAKANNLTEPNLIFSDNVLKLPR